MTATSLGCLVRDGYRCFRCGKPLQPGQGNCHHRLSAALGPDTLDNRITLCGFGNHLSDANGNELCHGWCHQNGREARANGWIVSRHSTLPPAETPVLHWRAGLVLLAADGSVTDLEGNAVILAA